MGFRVRLGASAFAVVLVAAAPPVSAVDADLDEMSDAFELANGFDPLTADEDSNGTIDGRDDADADGLGNAAEEAVGSDPKLADTDGDGLSDGSEIGTGDFSQTPTLIGSVIDPSAGEPADLDGDGDLDYVMADNFGSVIAARNLDGQGTFGALDFIALTEAGESLAVGDVDGDGDPDVVSEREDDVFLWTNDGSGSFGPIQPVATLPLFVTVVLLTDFDGDGDPDLVLGGSDVRFGENTDGLGTFSAPQIIIAGVAGVEAADLDRDGDVDLLAGGSWYENTDGMGTLGSATLLPAGAHTPTDVDGDGDLDLLNTGPEIGWHEDTNGAQSFGAKQTIATGFQFVFDVLGSDVDFDGDTDVLAAVRYPNGAGEIVWFENTDGAGSFGPLKSLATGHQNPGVISAVDVDGDGDLDLSFKNQAGFEGDFLWVEQHGFANPLLADTDGDGWSDGQEAFYRTDPLDPDDFPALPALGPLGLAALAAALLVAARRLL